MLRYKIKKNLQIAVDGPVASGKSTVASLIAKKLGILYVYTGAMYRAVAYLARKHQLSYDNETKILALLKKYKISLVPTDKKDKFCLVYLNSEEVTDKLFTPEISWGSSAVAVLPGVRRELVKSQKEIAKDQSVIMEGRDITTRVLPQADLKIYMTADFKKRAERRLEQLKERGISESFKKIIEDTKKRDYQDSHRQVDPPTIVPGAYVLDTTNLSINQVVDKVLSKLIELKLILSYQT